MTGKIMHTRHIKAVLFDLDDTLWPIVPVIRRAETILHDFLQTHAPAVTAQFSTDQLREIRSRLLAADPAYQVDLWRLRHAVLSVAFHACGADLSLIDPAMAVFSRARNAVTPYDDVVPGLTSLALRLKVGSISNGAADLEEIGMAHHFHYSIAAHQAGCAKPDPAIFLGACDALGVLPAEAVYVGDDPALDVEAAQNAGLLGVWMRRSGLETGKTMPAHIKPDTICRSLPELEKWLSAHI
jgi:2-haloalkanoic acid dehalogenase type II